MKKLLFVTVALLFCTSSFAGMLIGSGVDAGGAVTLLGPITFEDPPYTAGSELSSASGEGWIEDTPSTGVFLSSATHAQTGTQSAAFIVNVTGPYLHKVYAEQTGLHTLDFYMLANDATNDSGRIGVADGDSATGAGVSIRYNANDIQSYNGSTWDDVTTGDAITDATFYHIEIEVTPSADTFKIWVDGVQQGTTFGFVTSISAPDRFYMRAYTSGSAGIATFIDDLEIYSGARQ